MVPNINHQDDKNGEAGSQVPAISLPKGGRANRGIDGEFHVNPVTGAGPMTGPIATTPDRQGFDLQLSLSYDSSTSNGHSGLGWNLALDKNDHHY